MVEGAGATVVFDVMNPMVFFGILVGAAIPAVFSAMLMNGVNRNSQVMVKEIHRQFNSIPGLREGTSPSLTTPSASTSPPAALSAS